MRFLMLPIAALAVFMSAIAGPAIGKTTLEALLADLPVLRGASPVEGELDNHVVLIAFFASWCPPCAAEFGEISNYIEANGADKVSVIAVNWIEDLVPLDQGRMDRMMARDSVGSVLAA